MWQVISIWCGYLKQHLTSLEQVLVKLASPSSSGKCSLPGLEPEQMLSPSLKLEVSKQAEAISTLHTIRQLREEDALASPHLLTPVYYTLSLLHTVTRELSRVCMYSISTSKLLIWALVSVGSRVWKESSRSMGQVRRRGIWNQWTS